MREGESVVQLLPSEAADESTSAEVADVVFADLDDTDLAVDVSAGSRVAAQSMVPVAQSSSQSDDDDDTLNLLADDVTGLWY